jgi:hypothetical protein
VKRRPCAFPGCGAEVLTQTMCQRHRPPDRSKRKPLTEEERVLARERDRRRRLLAGLPAGWEGT